jgi:DNA-binding NarL/FixJ family response regulator
MTVQVAIADEMDLALEGIQTILRLHGMFQVTGTYQALVDLVEALKSQPPHVILIGDRLEPDMDVLELVERVQQAAPRARLLVLGTLPSGLIVQELLHSSAAGYLYKNDPLSGCLAEAIQTVLRGRLYLSPTANSEYLLAMQTDRAEWRLDAEARDVLRLLAQGQRPQEIAFQRHIPVRRVYNVCERLRRRFGVETNEELMVRAAAEGFIS